VRGLGLLAASAAALLLVPAQGKQTTPNGPITALAWLPEHRIAVSGYSSVRILDALTGAEQTVIPLSMRVCTGLTYLHGDRALYASGGVPGEQGAVQRINLTTGKPESAVRVSDDLLTGLAFFGASGLAAASSTAELFTWQANPPAGSPILLGRHTAPARAVVGAAGGSLVSAGDDSTLRVWNPPQMEPLHVLIAHTAPVRALALRTDPGTGELHCASGSDDKTLRIWFPLRGRLVRSFRGFTSPVLAVAWRARDGALFAAEATGRIQELHPETGEMLKTWRPVDDWIYEIAVDEDGCHLAAGDARGGLHVISLDGPRP